MALLDSFLDGLQQISQEPNAGFRLPEPDEIAYEDVGGFVDLRHVGHPFKMTAEECYTQVLRPAMRSGELADTTEDALWAEVQEMDLEAVQEWTAEILRANPWPPGFHLPTFVEFVSGTDYLNSDVSPTPRQRRAIEESIGVDARAWFVEPRRLSTIILCWGKGSGKDLLCNWVCAYVAWSVAFMRNPWFHFNMPSGEVLDIVNVAQDQDSARAVFFAKLKNSVQKACFQPLLDQAKDILADSITFRKPVPGEIFPRICVRINSLHSGNEKAEGRNTFLYIMDEADAMRDAKGHNNARKMFNTLTTSNRFGSRQLGIVISYPRAKNGFMFEMLAKCGNLKGKTVEWWGDLAATYRVLHWKCFEPIEVGGQVRWTNPTGFVSSEPDLEMARLFRDDPETFRAMYECLSGKTWVVDDGGLVQLRHAKNRIPKGVRPTIRICTRYGYTLECTADHHLLTPVQGGTRWVAASALKPGDPVCISQQPQPFGTLDPDTRLAELAGLLVGDGWVAGDAAKKPDVAWVYDRQDLDVAVRHEAFLRELGETPCRLERDTSVVVRLRSKEAYDRFRECIGEPKRATEKRVPTWVFQSEKAVVAAFLRGLFEADGSINKRGVICFGTSSEQLGQDVQALLGLFGITALLRARPAKPNKWGGVSAESWTLELSQRRSIRFWQEIGFLSSRKQGRCRRYNPDGNSKFRSDTKLYRDTVVTVAEVGEQEVFDLFDRPNQRFFANGFIAHNCEPPAAEDAFISQAHRIDECIIPYLRPIARVENTTTHDKNAVTGEVHRYVALLLSQIVMRPGVIYYVGGDAGVSGDSFALCIAHVVPPNERGYCSPDAWRDARLRLSKHYKPEPLPLHDPNWRPEMWRCDHTGVMPVPGQHQFWGVCRETGVPVLRQVQIGEDPDGAPIYAKDHEGRDLVREAYLPTVVEDLLLEWKPNKAKGLTVDFRNVRDLILELKRHGNIGYCYFDQWQAVQMIQDLRAAGIPCETKAFGAAAQLEWYRNYKSLLYNHSVQLLPGEERARRQLRELQLVNGRAIDHPAHSADGGMGAKDLTDAEALAFWLCCSPQFAPSRIDTGTTAPVIGMHRQAQAVQRRKDGELSIVQSTIRGLGLG